VEREKSFLPFFGGDAFCYTLIRRAFLFFAFRCELLGAKKGRRRLFLCGETRRGQTSPRKRKATEDREEVGRVPKSSISVVRREGRVVLLYHHECGNRELR
jgi:hypothetical protein